ncbi:hypothetical protein LJR098_001110 [Rhizobium sp. LjRoot98]|uniref:hypothetical protein n=1 Tax=Rhizobium sp. LjRoot98 TaxID=3342345 RepID=UPI003ECFF475
MQGPDLSALDPAYLKAISEIRGRLTDEQIADVLERYVAGGIDRDEAMESLDVNYLGVLYTAVSVYKIERPELDQAEIERGAEAVRMWRNGEHVPVELRQPASWKVRH